MWSDAFLFVLRFVGSRQDAGAALVFKPIALTSNLNDGRVVQDPIKHSSGEHSVARKRLVPTTECEARRVMNRWRVELGERDKYLGVVEAENEDEAVEAAAEKFRVPDAERHKIMVSKSEKEGEQKAQHGRPD
jgi:hypothetical protein